MQWDQFAFTDGYSPRNEAFIYGNYFVELWNHLVGEEIRPHSKFRPIFGRLESFHLLFEKERFNQKDKLLQTVFTDLKISR